MCLRVDQAYVCSFYVNQGMNTTWLHVKELEVTPVEWMLRVQYPKP